MKSIFKGGKKVSRKYHFYIHIHNVSPWPAHFKSLFIAWSRGTSKKGVTKAVAAVPGEPGRSLETAFHVPCTVVQVLAHTQALGLVFWCKTLSS